VEGPDSTVDFLSQGDVDGEAHYSRWVPSKYIQACVRVLEAVSAGDLS
jgi:hypothetical protein